MFNPKLKEVVVLSKLKTGVLNDNRTKCQQLDGGRANVLLIHSSKSSW